MARFRRFLNRVRFLFGREDHLTYCAKCKTELTEQARFPRPCSVCKEIIEKEGGPNVFGQHFCSEHCLDEFWSTTGF